MKNTFIEKFDQDKLNTILENEAHFKEVINIRRGGHIDNKGWQFKIAKDYLNASKNGCFNTTYASKSGRLFAKESLSLQTFPREIRYTIAKEFYTDIDMVNCHVVIFAYYCGLQDFDCPFINEYINDREAKLKLVSDNRTLAKETYLSIINGGTKLYNAIENKHPFIIAFKKEVYRLHLKFADTYNEMYEAHCDRREEANINYNHLGSFVNKLFCKMENKILMKVWTHYKKSKNVVLCFDGIMVLKSMFNVSDIAEIEALVLKELNINMKFSIKEMDFEFDFTDIPIIRYDDSPFGKIQNQAKNNLTVLEFSKLKEEIIEYVNMEHCLIMCGKTFYMKECIDIDCDERYFELVYKDLASMRIDFADKDVDFCIDDKIKTINIFDIWNKSLDRRKYDGLDFMPYSSFLTKQKMEQSLSRRYKKYNLFHGLAQPFEELEDIKPYEFDINIGFFDHILTRWCKGDTELNEYVLNWFAHLIQKPHIKMGTAIVLKSAERSGKGIIIQLIKDIIGSEYFYQPLNVNDILGNFNGGLANKLLVFLDELSWGGDKQKSGILKKIITESTITINEKHKPVYSCQNCINTIIASNEGWIVPAGMTSTRYQIIETSDELAMMTDKIEKKKIINNILKVDIKRLAKFFYERDISEFNPSNIINTEALISQKLQSMDGINKWYVGVLSDESIDCSSIERRISKAQVYEDFVKTNKHISSVHFWRWMKQNAIYSEHKSGTVRLIQLGDIDRLREKWAGLNNCDWKDVSNGDIEEEEMDEDMFCNL